MLITWMFGEPIAFGLTGLQLDLFQFIYDVLLTALMGYVVWKITSYCAEQRQIRKAFHSEVQDLSRYLGALKELVELFPKKHNEEEIVRLMALSPRHESFAYLEKGYEVLWDLAEEEQAIRGDIGRDMADDFVFRQHGSELLRLRNQIVRLELPKNKLVSHHRKRLTEQIERDLEADAVKPLDNHCCNQDSIRLG